MEGTTKVRYRAPQNLGRVFECLQRTLDRKGAGESGMIERQAIEECIRALEDEFDVMWLKYTGAAAMGRLKE